jgi:NAD(P)-dependent dehydrogenase (short-subunit alcohol dehydrogenase family)
MTGTNTVRKEATMRLKNKAIIVTGAGRGIARAAALLMAREGARVVVVDTGSGRGGEDVGERPADEVVAEIRKGGGISFPMYDSIADYTSAGKIVQACVREFGRVDGLVNMAGILRERMIWNMTEDDFDAVINVHLKGYWNMCHHAIKQMRSQGFGRIVNASSDAFKGSVGQCNYAAAKGGIISLSRSIAKEVYRYGITCNALCPSADTRMTVNDKVLENRRRKVAAGLMTQEQFDLKMQPHGPEYVAPLIAYLCTDHAHYLNGRVFHIERGVLHAYWFGEERNRIDKNENDGMFSLDELYEKMPSLEDGVARVVPRGTVEDESQQAAGRNNGAQAVREYSS